MKIKVLIDMNLSPDWAPYLIAGGVEALHWSTIGDIRAKDQVIMAYALQHRFVVFTHDLDFGTLLALTHASGPSVVQVRAEDVLPQSIGQLVLSAIRQHEADLVAGALLVVDEARSRVRVLPIG